MGSIDVNEDSNPADLIKNIMSSGVINELVGSMTSGLKEGTIDQNELMGSVSSMMSGLTGAEGAGGAGGAGDMNDLFSNLMKNQTKPSPASSMKIVEEENSIIKK